MDKPEYAQSWSDEKYKGWTESWRYRSSAAERLLQGGGEYTIATIEDAYVLLNIAMNDADELEETRRNEWATKGLDNDGRSIGTIAAVIQYRPEIAIPALERVVLEFPYQDNLDSLKLLWLCHALNYGSRKSHAPATIDRVLEWMEAVSGEALVLKKVERAYTPETIPASVFDSIGWLVNGQLQTELTGGDYSEAARAEADLRILEGDLTSQQLSWRDRLLTQAERAIRLGNIGPVHTFNHYASDERIAANAENIRRCVAGEKGDFIRKTCTRLALVLG